MSLWSVTRVVFIVLTLITGLLFAIGRIRARKVADQAVFVAGWFLALLSGFVIVQSY